jgi:hypothetical protein
VGRAAGTLNILIGVLIGVLIVAVAILAALAFPATAASQITPPCGPTLATAGGTAWTCPLGGIRNIVDIEGGSVHYENGVLDQPKLDLNISSGEHRGVRSRVAINPDVGGPGTVIFDGRRNRIASFYPEGIELFAPVTFHAGTVVQDQRVERLAVRLAALRLRVQRLARAVRRLRAAR